MRTIVSICIAALCGVALMGGHCNPATAGSAGSTANAAAPDSTGAPVSAALRASAEPTALMVAAGPADAGTAAAPVSGDFRLADAKAAFKSACPASCPSYCDAQMLAGCSTPPCTVPPDMTLANLPGASLKTAQLVCQGCYRVCPDLYPTASPSPDGGAVSGLTR